MPRRSNRVKRSKRSKRVNRSNRVNRSKRVNRTRRVRRVNRSKRSNRVRRVNRSKRSKRMRGGALQVGDKVVYRTSTPDTIDQYLQVKEIVMDTKYKCHIYQKGNDKQIMNRQGGIAEVEVMESQVQPYDDSYSIYDVEVVKGVTGKTDAEVYDAYNQTGMKAGTYGQHLAIGYLMKDEA